MAGPGWAPDLALSSSSFLHNQEKASHHLFCITSLHTYKFCPFFSSQECHKKQRGRMTEAGFPQKSLRGCLGWGQAGSFFLASQTACLELSRSSEEVCALLRSNWLVQAHTQGHPRSEAPGPGRTLQ